MEPSQRRDRASDEQLATDSDLEPTHSVQRVHPVNASVACRVTTQPRSNAFVFASVAVYALALCVQLSVAIISFNSLVSAAQG